jgi:hypothetical protein
LGLGVGTTGTGEAVVWDFATGKHRVNFQPDQERGDCAVFSPDGKWIALE